MLPPRRLVALCKFCNFFNLLDFKFDKYRYIFVPLCHYEWSRLYQPTRYTAGIGTLLFALIHRFTSPRDMYYLLLMAFYHPENMFLKPGRPAKYLNRIVKGLTKTKKLTRKLTSCPWPLYVSYFLKILGLLDFLIFHITLPCRETKHFIAIAFLGTYQIILRTYVKMQRLFIELRCIFFMLVHINDYMQEVLKDLETCELELPFYLDNFKNRTRRINALYRRLLKVLIGFNSLMASDIKRIIILTAASFLLMFEPGGTSMRKQVATFYLVFLWDIFFELIWYRGISKELKRGRFLIGTSRLKRDFEWDKQVDGLLISISIAQLTLQEHLKDIQNFFHSALLVIIVSLTYYRLGATGKYDYSTLLRAKVY